MRDPVTPRRVIETVVLRAPTYLALVDTPAVGMYGLPIDRGSFNRLARHFNLMPSGRDVPERKAVVLPPVRRTNAHLVVYQDGPDNLEIELMHVIAFLKEADKSRWYLFLLRDEKMFLAHGVCGGGKTISLLAVFIQATKVDGCLIAPIRFGTGIHHHGPRDKSLAAMRGFILIVRESCQQ